ncbi:MAG: DUF928 domain-containing protein [Symploca sp. SIO3E6]|nr:DUF928 domain-containing protein [Caldora sp. SIO3E6]
MMKTKFQALYIANFIVLGLLTSTQTSLFRANPMSLGTEVRVGSDLAPTLITRQGFKTPGSQLKSSLDDWNKALVHFSGLELLARSLNSGRIMKPIENSARSKVEVSSKPPAPPDTGTPTGNPKPGTTRPEANCPAMEPPLTALVANNGSDYTLSEYPTFWFYIPYAPEDISTIEFLLLDSKERKTIYKTGVKLTEKPGIIQVTIPAKPQYALQLQANYRWRLNLDCQPDTTDEPDLVVDGWIQRQPSNSQLENQLEAVQSQEYLVYREQEIWYDAIANLAELYFANPEDGNLQEAWANLLASLGLAGVAQEPFVQSELVVVED